MLGSFVSTSAFCCPPSCPRASPLAAREGEESEVATAITKPLPKRRRETGGGTVEATGEREGSSTEQVLGMGRMVSYILLLRHLDLSLALPSRNDGLGPHAGYSWVKVDHRESCVRR